MARFVGGRGSGCARSSPWHSASGAARSHSSCRLGPRLGRPCRNENAGCRCGHGRAVDGGWARPSLRGTSSRALPACFRHGGG